MFSITTEQRNNLSFVILKNETNGELVEIIPDIGATVHALRLCLSGEAANILYRDSDEEILSNPLFRNRILFPFNDQIPHGAYTFNNTPYVLKTDGSTDAPALHGFVAGRRFTHVEQENTHAYARVTLRTTITEDEFQGYPFALLLQITYTLREHTFSIHFHIRNNGTSSAPLSFGWHPYFTFNGSIRNSQCTIHTDHYCEADAANIPTRRILDCTDTDYDFRKGKSIADLTIDHAFLAPQDGIAVLCQDENKIELYQDPTIFKYMQIYSPDDHQSIAIEPVTAAPNCFNFHELGLLSIHPGQEIKTFITVKTETK